MKFLVIGDSCSDIYVYCSSTRFCPDAPVPVLNPIKTISSLGMAGNVADNLKGLETTVDFITNEESIKKIRYVDDRTNHMFIRIDEGESNIERISKNILENIKWEEYEAVIVSDYCKGFLLEEDLKYISQHHPLTFLDTKKQLNGFADDFTFIKINDIEYSKTKSTILPHLEEKLIVTLGSKGAKFKNKTYPVKQVDVRDTSGAGDTFIAGLTYKYALSLDIQEAIKFANKCSSQVVQKKGTAKVNINEL
jgi:D-beta-D-heptose 7-phosphate kinase/D-beta-D-heptose 1-phosphate adenosyltransferase